MVKPEEGVVTAEFVSTETGEPISWAEHIQRRLMNSVFGKYPWLTHCRGLWKEIRTSVADYDTVAKAYCHEEDVFDEETGKAIAKARLLWRWDCVTYDSISIVKRYIRNELENVYNSANMAQSTMWKPMEKHQKALMAAYHKVEDVDAGCVG